MTQESTCDICYRQIQEHTKRHYCNNCGNDFHQKCITIAVTKDNKCPNCKNPFYDGYKEEEDFTPDTYNTDLSDMSNWGLKWYHYIIFLEVIIIALIANLGLSPTDFLFTSIAALLISLILGQITS